MIDKITYFFQKLNGNTNNKKKKALPFSPVGKGFKRYKTAEKPAKKNVPDRRNGKVGQSYSKVRKLETAAASYERFLNGMPACGLNEALDEGVRLWKVNRLEKERYELTVPILKLVQAEGGLIFHLRQLEEFADTLDRFDDDNINSLKQLGFNSFIKPLQKDYERILQQSTAFLQLPKEPCHTVTPSEKKAFLANECKGIDCLYRALQSMNRIETAKQEVWLGNDVPYRFVTESLQALNKAFKDEAVISDVKAVCESLYRRNEALQIENRKVDEILEYLQYLQECFNDAWFAQFDPKRGEGELADIEDKAALQRFYQKRVKNIRKGGSKNE